MSHSPQDLSTSATDPVCGMSVNTSTAKEKMDYQGTTYYFCSSGCKQSFAADPEKYVGGAKAGHSHHH